MDEDTDIAALQKFDINSFISNNGLGGGQEVKVVPQMFAKRNLKDTVILPKKPKMGYDGSCKI